MSCGPYSFTGASISPDVKTIAVNEFPNFADIIVPSLSQTFTEALRDRFVSQTNLSITDKQGDLGMEGSITGYTVTPIAPTGNQTAALNRLTITVNVQFTNNKDEEQNWETRFSRYTEYDSNLNLSDIEESLIEDITEQLVNDIFNKAVVNW